MGIRATDDRSCLDSSIGVDDGVLNAIDSLHREYLLRLTQSPGNENRMLFGKKSALLRLLWIAPPQMAGRAKTKSPAVPIRPFNSVKGSEDFRNFCSFLRSFFLFYCK